MISFRRFSVFALGLLMFAGCAGSSDTELAEPHLGNVGLDRFAKADVTDTVSVLGPLFWEQALEGEFVRDFQFDAYTIYAVQSSLISLYTTGARNSESLDTTLFLFGPQTKTDGFGDKFIAWDNDSGWGKHARIDNYKVTQDGVYLVVVGTPFAAGRGHYVVVAACESEDCDGDLPINLEEAELPGDIGESVHRAVESCQESVAELGLDCIVDAVAFSYYWREQIPDPGIREVVEALLDQFGYSEHCAFGGNASESDLQEVLESMGLPGFISSSKEFVQSEKMVGGWGYCWSYLQDREEQRIMHYYVMQYPETNQVITVAMAIWESDI